jgi:hypothetical protein
MRNNESFVVCIWKNEERAKNAPRDDLKEEVKKRKKNHRKFFSSQQ